MEVYAGYGGEAQSILSLGDQRHWMWSSFSGHNYCQGKLFHNLLYSTMRVPRNSFGHNGAQANHLFFSGNLTLLIKLILNHFTNWAVETKNFLSLKQTLWDICTVEWWDWIPSRSKRLASSKYSRPAVGPVYCQTGGLSSGAKLAEA